MFLLGERVHTMSNNSNKSDAIEIASTEITQSPTNSPTLTPTTVAKKVVTKAPPTARPLPVLNGGNIFGMVNAYRTANGRLSLSVSDELCTLAEPRADYMMANEMTAFKAIGSGRHTGFLDVSDQYSGGGVGERPLMSAGGTWRRFRSKGRKFPIVRGVAQAAYVHPHGGGRHQHVGQSSTVSRNAPPGAKVGSIAARKTGRARIKERK